MEVSFKTRVKFVLEECALDYLHNFIGKKYIVYSSNFTKNEYYTIDAKKDNYLHLTGVITNLRASVFFDKCITGALEENDFELGDKNSKPLTLLKGNMLRNPSPVDLIVQKDNDKQCIPKIIFNKNNLNLSEIAQLLPLEMRG